MCALQRFHCASVHHLHVTVTVCVYMCLYIRRPQLGEGVYLLLRVLAELPGDFSGLRQLLRQVGSDVLWQLLARVGRRTVF